MPNQIVTVNVTSLAAPTPSLQQKKGAFISQGATTLSSGTAQLLTQSSDLTSILTGAVSLSSLTWSGGVVTATSSAPHGVPTSDTFEVTITGATPSGYNGMFLATATGANTFTYTHGGTLSTPASPAGSWTPEDVSELVAMNATFFAQGSGQGVWVLELGIGSPADGVTALTTYIAANQGQFGGPFYSYLVPRTWASESTYITFLANYEALTSRTYFFTTMTTGNYTSFTSLMKDVVGLVEAPSIPSTEFSLAAAFFKALNYSPSSTNKVTPFAFSFLFGVTAYPLTGNSTILASLKTAHVNVVGTGAEGGLSNTILFWGTTMDGNDFTYWYSVDWVQINLDLNTANAVINGSNNPLNPLYYNQDGINRLQAVAASTMNQGVSFGLVLGAPVLTEYNAAQFVAALDAGFYDGVTGVNADPFIPYNTENPNDYAQGKYAGLSVVYTPARGFTSIVYNVLVQNFVAT